MKDVKEVSACITIQLSFASVVDILTSVQPRIERCAAQLDDNRDHLSPHQERMYSLLVGTYKKYCQLAGVLFSTVSEDFIPVQVDLFQLVTAFEDLESLRPYALEAVNGGA